MIIDMLDQMLITKNKITLEFKDCMKAEKDRSMEKATTATFLAVEIPLK